MLVHTLTSMHIPWTPPTTQVGAPELELAVELDDDTVVVVEDELTAVLDELVVVVVVVEELEATELELAFAPLLDGPVVISVPVLPPAPPAPTTLPPRPSVVVLVLVTAPPIALDPDERPPRPSVAETRPGL
jgi:hypothetical protein